MQACKQNCLRTLCKYVQSTVKFFNYLRFFMYYNFFAILYCDIFYLYLRFFFGLIANFYHFMFVTNSIKPKDHDLANIYFMKLSFSTRIISSARIILFLTVIIATNIKCNLLPFLIEIPFNFVLLLSIKNFICSRDFLNNFKNIVNVQK